MITTAILSVVGVLGFVALSSAATSVNNSDARGMAQSDVREVVAQMAGEIELAAKANKMTPPVQRVQVALNGAVVSPGTAGNSMTFQIPLNNTGTLWSTPITFTFQNEDTNANGLLDGGEDTNGDKILTRRITRAQDINGDGDSSDPGESRPMAGANNLSAVNFTLNNDRDTLSVTATATRAIAKTQRNQSGTIRSNMALSSVTTTIYILN